VCPYDAAERLGIEVRFVDFPSMEGMYIKGTLQSASPHILVSALRPFGRQASTGAHELGHHVFGHVTRIDQYIPGGGAVGSAIGEDALGPKPPRAPSIHRKRYDPDEILADAFGAFFLVPKPAVERGFGDRGLAPATATPAECFAVAGWLGVGYTMLVHQMRSSLGLMSSARAAQLLAVKPKSIREQLIGLGMQNDVFVVDHAWLGRAVDLQVGDIAVVPAHTRIEPTTGRLSPVVRNAPGEMTETANGLPAFEATAPGLGRLVGTDWAVYVRVAKREYVGRNIFRHMEREEGDDDVEGREGRAEEFTEGKVKWDVTAE